MNADDLVRSAIHTGLVASHGKGNLGNRELDDGLEAPNDVHLPCGKRNTEMLRFHFQCFRLRSRAFNHFRTKQAGEGSEWFRMLVEPKLEPHLR